LAARNSIVQGFAWLPTCLHSLGFGREVCGESTGFPKIVDKIRTHLIDSKGVTRDSVPRQQLRERRQVLRDGPGATLLSKEIA